MLEQQMELFEDGGLRDEGGEIDEVSGNEVPIGGTKKGVRDDVPAMVSEGEFVFPEDVTRYIGLDKLMQMRQEAKMGLKRMEAMGQMGNGDEATMPDDLPFDMADLIIVAGDTGEELEMQEGGFVRRPTTARRTLQQPVYTQPPIESAPEFSSVRSLTPTIPRSQRSTISFKDLMADAILEFKEYRNAEGQSLLVAFVGGKPVYPIPAGYTLYNPEAVEEEPSETTETAEETNEVIKQAVSSSSEKDASDLPKSEFQLAGSWDGAPLDLVYKEGSKFVGGAADLAAGAVGVLAGPIAPVVYLFTKLEKRKYESKLDGYIARAKEEGRQDLVEKFTAHKKSLAEGGQGLIGKAIDAVSKIFSPEEVETEIANVSTKVSAEPAAVNKVESTLISDAVSQRIGSELSSILNDPAVSQEGKNNALLLSTQNLATIDAGGRFGNLVEEVKALTGQDFDAQKLLPPTVPAGRDIDRAFDPVPTPPPVSIPDPRIDVSRQPVIDAPYPFPDDPPPSVLSPVPDTTPVKSDPAPITVPQQTYTSTGAQMQASQKALEDIVPKLPDPATVPVLSQPKPAPITKGIGTSATPSPRLGYESGQDVQQSVAPYLQGTVGGQPEFYSPPQIVTTQAQVEAPSAPQLAQPEAFTATLPKPDPSMDPTGVGKFPPLTPEAPAAVSPLPPTVDTTPVATAPSYATMPMGEAGRGVVSTAKGRDMDAAFDPVPTESAAPDTSLRPKARPVVTEEKVEKTVKPKARPVVTEEKVEKTVKPKAKPEPVQDKKTTRLDSTNPNTSTNIANHLSETEKTSLKANPSLAEHYTATANRRANEAAKGDTSNTDAAKEKDNKIVCTAMNNAYGFGSYRQAIWLSYSKDYLTKEHEIGYHTLFLPLVDLAYNKNNKFVRVALEHIARHRTADLRASMQNKKRNTLGRIYRCVLEPLVYTIGKFRIITGI